MRSVAVGLRILTSETTSSSSWLGDSSNVVINYGVKSIKPIFEMTQRSSNNNSTCLDPECPPCFLKSCFLCTKILRLDEDVYMYRGDQGFCSEVCRNRQIYVDEMREIEKSTVGQSFRCCRNSTTSHWRDTKKLLEGFRHRRELPISGQVGRTTRPPVFTFS